MSVLSLDDLTGERAGVEVVSIEIRRSTSSKMTVEAIDLLFPKLAEGPIYGLPATLGKNSTYLYAGLWDSEDEDVWELRWLRMPNADVPPPVAQALYGSAEQLERVLSTAWSSHSEDSIDFIQITYDVTGYTTKLLAAGAETAGALIARPAGTFWRLENAQFLLGLSPSLLSDGRLRFLALASLKGGHWVNVAHIDLLVWSEVLPFLTKAAL